MTTTTRRKRAAAYRILERGTAIYKPTGTDRRWRVVATDVTGRRASRPVADEKAATDLARLWEKYQATRTPIPQRRRRARLTPVDQGQPAPGAAAHLRDHVAEWLRLMAPVRTPHGWMGWSANHHSNATSSFRNHILDVEVRPGRKWGDLWPEEWTAIDSRLLLQTAAANGLGKAALTRTRAHLSSFQRHLHEANALPPGVLPASRIALPQVLGVEAAEEAGPIHRETLPSMAECEKLITATAERGRSDLAVAFRLKHFAGPRFSELMALRPDDVDVEGLSVRIVRVWDPQLRSFVPTKNRRRRETFFPALIADELGDWCERVRAERGPDALLFPNSRGNVMSYGSFHDHWLRSTLAAGWPMTETPRQAPTPSGHHLFRGRCQWTPHDLRHVAACWMLFDVRMDPGDVSAALGHYSVEFTLRVYAGARGDTSDVRSLMANYR